MALNPQEGKKGAGKLQTRGKKAENPPGGEMAQRIRSIYLRNGPLSLRPYSFPSCQNFRDDALATRVLFLGANSTRPHAQMRINADICVMPAASVHPRYSKVPGQPNFRRPPHSLDFDLAEVKTSCTNSQVSLTRPSFLESVRMLPTFHLSLSSLFSALSIFPSRLCTS